MSDLRPNKRRAFLLMVGTLLLPLLIVGGSPRKVPAGHQSKSGRDRIEVGDMDIVEDSLGNFHPVVTWALLTPEDDIEEVGVTIPVELFDNQPTELGPNPRGAIASVDFPEIVQAFTFFNHFEIHTEPHGHPITPLAADPDRYRPAHFDFHFFSIPEAQVWMIPNQEPPLPQVAAELLPAGYFQPFRSEQQMGRHSLPLSDITTIGPFSDSMIAGFLSDASKMHFIEPMVSRAKLLEANDFELPVPMPKEFGRLMLYPTKFEAEYDKELDAYHFVFSKFEIVE